MRTLMLFAERRPWLVFALISVIALLAAVQLPELKLEITAEGMMVEDDPARIFYNKHWTPLVRKISPSSFCKMTTCFIQPS